MDEQNKKTWLLIPVAWAFAIIGVLAIQLSGYLLCRIGAWAVGEMANLPTILIIALIFLFGGLYASLVYYALILIPALTVQFANQIFPSKNGVRYYVIGIYEVISCALLIYAGAIGIVKGGPMFWFYARFIFIAISSIILMLTGKEEAKQYKKIGSVTEKKAFPVWVLWCVLAVLIVAIPVAIVFNSSAIDAAYQRWFADGMDNAIENTVWLCMIACLVMLIKKQFKK